MGFNGVYWWFNGGLMVDLLGLMVDLMGLMVI